MKQLICILCFSLFWLSSWSMGGIWLLEVNYTSQGENRKAFIYSDFFADKFDELVGKDSLFQTQLESYYKASDSVIVYETIIDQEILAKHANFPMHPFRLNPDHRKMMAISEFENISMVKLWKTIAYEINLLTHLNLSDTNWISEKASVKYPVGNEIGCRLEVHQYTNKPMLDEMVEELGLLYLRIGTVYSPKDNFDISDAQRLGYLVHRLKEMKAVVVELCGC